MSKLTAAEYISKYSISLADAEHIKIASGAKAKRDGALDGIVACKESIISELTASKAAHDARIAAIDDIDGLAEIRAAVAAENAYKAAYDRAWSAGQQDYPDEPSVKSADLKAMYPRAAAYIKASAWAASSNHAKAVAGSEAVEAIIAGEDYEQALASMDNSWGEYCSAHAWA